MKKQLFLFLFSFTLANLNAQKAIEFNWSLAYGYSDPESSLSLAYYHPLEPRSGLVFRANYLSTKNNRIGKGIQTIQMDLQERFQIVKRDRLFIFVEMGISGMAINEWISEYLLNCKASFCGHRSYENNVVVNGFSWNNKYYKLSFAPGLMSGVGMGSQLSKKIYVGLIFRFGSYYWSANKEVLPYVNYGLNAGYSF